MNRNSDSGFTLIELLVVVAIIALLVTIIMPSLGRAKALARTMHCQSNLHQQSLGVLAYSLDYGHSFPIGIDMIDWTTDWSQLVNGYIMQDAMNWDGQGLCPAFQCPDAVYKKGKVHFASHPRLMADLGKINKGWVPAYKTLHVRRPSELVLTMDSGQTPSSGNAHSTAWRLDDWGWYYGDKLVYDPDTAGEPIEVGVNSDEYEGRGDVRYRHMDNDVACFSFVDGHAESFEIGTVLQRNVRVAR